MLPGPGSDVCGYVGLVLALLLLFLLCATASADNPAEVAMALSKKADDFVAQGKYMEAIELYNEAIAKDPYSSTTWNRLGKAEMNVGRYPDAVAAFQKALELDPYYSAAWKNKGDALHAQEKYQAAIEAYDRALAINPNDLSSLLQKGINLQLLGKSTQAMEVYTEVVRLAEREVRRNPNTAKYDATLWTNKGDALSRLGRHQEALQAYQTAVEINPKMEAAIRGIELTNETLYRARVSPESLNTPIFPVETTHSEMPIPSSCLVAPLAFVILAVLSLPAYLRIRKGT